jgi:hypothetical protein
MTSSRTQKLSQLKQRAPLGVQVIRHGKLEEHAYIAWGSDPCFERCACGHTRRVPLQSIPKLPAEMTPEGGRHWGVIATDAVRVATLMNPNPCVRAWGLGPAGAQCNTCVFLVHHQQSATWYKCGKREAEPAGSELALTGGRKTDQRVRWDVCAKYELRTPEALKAEEERRNGQLRAMRDAREQREARR